MAVIQRVVKPRNQKSKRALENREPKAVENTRKTLFVKGQNVSKTVLGCMKDLYVLKKSTAEFYGQKNPIRPFEDFTSLEKFSQKEDASLFAFGNNNKKRPDNLILGRFYDYHMLDMVEFGVENFKGLSDFKNEKVPSDLKPCLMFAGESFEKSEDMQRIKSLFVDFFRGPEVTNIRLGGLEHVIQFTALEEAYGSAKKIHFRSYKVHLKKSSTPNIPRIELEEIGPSMDLVVRRTHLASEDLFKTACKQVKNVRKKKKVKNIEEDAFGSKLGRVHIRTQKVSQMQTRKMKGLKVKRG